MPPGSLATHHRYLHVSVKERGGAGLQENEERGCGGRKGDGTKGGGRKEMKEGGSEKSTWLPPPGKRVGEDSLFAGSRRLD